MQDRFKFRFFDKKKNFLIDENTDPDKCVKLYDKDEWWWCVEHGLTTVLDYFDHCSYIQSRDFVIMQCTGLKDKNGKLIYEGDIVKITREKWTKERYNRFYIVCWDRTQWQLGLIKYQRAKAQPNRRPDRKMPFKNIVSFADYTPLKEFALCKVIGNVYENEDLLNE